MPRRSSFFGDLAGRLGRVSFGVVAGVAVASILAVLLGQHWLGLISLPHWAQLAPWAVLHGQIWRLATYPWIMLDPLSLLFTIWALVIFLPPLERAWGEKRTLFRLAVLVVAPAVLTVLLSIPVAGLESHPALGAYALTSALVVAYACELRGATIMIFPFPFRLSGDGLLVFEGVLLGLFVIFSGPLELMVSILSFAFALGWFRFSLFRDARRGWLRFRRRQLEGRMAKLRRRGGLRVVPPDDDDDQEPRRFLH